ncbi:alpha/beta fold hydrolase [Clostridiales bacterium COT073_COT-073]|nr:alpha/beta fold hydrolase [Clostridiales bacterium COT073_COT-073]
MDKYKIHQAIAFKCGVYKLNPEKNFDFQLNRLINWDGGRLEDVKPIAGKIKTSADWKRELIRLGDIAIADGRTENAIAYYRMSEFFMYDGDPDKKKYYKLATNLFYQYFADFFTGTEPIITQYKVPFKQAKLPVWHLKPTTKNKGIILLHGGNDSYFEEFLFPALYLREQGFEVYLFEGPGQGGVMRLQGLHFTHQWEKPVKAVLDYFQLDNITIIGASLGGYLAPRAAAFDRRITKIVAWSIFPCFQDVILGTQKPILRKIFHLLMKLHARPIINFIFYQKAKKEPMIDWGLKHGMYAYKAKDPYTYAQKLKLYDLGPIAHHITQDMLILGANQDHFINYQMIGQEINLLKSVKSLTFRLFTDKENAQNHCNAGNTKLVLDTICDWIEEI